MNYIIVPFRLYNTWLGIDVASVKSVESFGKIAFMPQAVLPVVGLMQKSGKILPVWSLFHLANGQKEDIKNCLYYLEVIVNDKSIAIPAHEILPVREVINSWIPILKYDVKLYRSLDKNPPQKDMIIQHNDSIIQPESLVAEGFQLEEIL